MQIKAVGAMSIQRIPHDRHPQSFLVGAVHAQLVGPPCAGTEDDFYCGVWNVE